MEATEIQDENTVQIDPATLTGDVVTEITTQTTQPTNTVGTSMINQGPHSLTVLDLGYRTWIEQCYHNMEILNVARTHESDQAQSEALLKPALLAAQRLRTYAGSMIDFIKSKANIRQDNATLMDEFRNFELSPFVFELNILEKTISQEFDELKFTQSQKEEIYREGFS